MSYYDSNRSELLPFIDDDIRFVLDIGCGSGNLGKSIKDKFNCKVDGVEINLEAAEKAVIKLDKVYFGSIESNLKNIPDKSYDLIILADVIEHLKTPKLILEKIDEKLSSQGQLLFSLPNFNHYYVLEKILKGNFNYEEEGLLDNTHISFLSKRKLISLLIDLNYFSISVKNLISFYDLDINLIKTLNENLELNKFIDECNNFQYIVKAFKNKPLINYSNKNIYFFNDRLPIDINNKLLELDSSFICIDDNNSENIMKLVKDKISYFDSVDNLGIVFIPYYSDCFTYQLFKKYSNYSKTDLCESIPNPNSCLLINKVVFDYIGGFDESFKNFTLAKYDFSLRAKLAGFEILYCGNDLIPINNISMDHFQDDFNIIKNNLNYNFMNKLDFLKESNNEYLNFIDLYNNSLSNKPAVFSIGLLENNLLNNSNVEGFNFIKSKLNEIKKKVDSEELNYCLVCIDIFEENYLDAIKKLEVILKQKKLNKDVFYLLGFCFNKINNEKMSNLFLSKSKGYDNFSILKKLLPFENKNLL